jgi:hypothetical protein
MVGALFLAANALSADVAAEFGVQLDGLRAEGLCSDGLRQCGVFIGAHPDLAIGYVERARCYMGLEDYHPAATDLRLGVGFGGG